MAVYAKLVREVGHGAGWSREEWRDSQRWGGKEIVKEILTDAEAFVFERSTAA